MRRHLLVICLASFSACGSPAVDKPDAASLARDCGLAAADASEAAPDAAEPAPDAGTLPDAEAPDASPAPRIVFTQGENEEAHEVTSVVYAQEYDVRAEGFVPGETIMLETHLWGYQGQADFVVGPDGTIDLARDAPVSGSYQGVDADGLVWSMTKLDNNTANNYAVNYTAFRAGAVVAQGRIDRTPLGGDATTVDVRDNGLWGELYVPPGAGPNPALLVLGGSEGGEPDFEAAYYESMGYETLALAYFGEPGLPSDLTDIPLEYFDTAVEWMRARPEIDPQRIGVAGGSRGGELALILGARRSDLRVVIASVPSGLVFGSTADANLAGWTSGGVEVPYFNVATTVGPVPEKLPNGDTGYRDAPAMAAMLDAATPADIDRARIHVENTNGPILMLASGDDGIWPSCRLSEIAWSTLTAQGHSARFADASFCFPNAGHLVGAPGWPTAEDYAVETSSGTWLIAGGTAQGYGQADREADTAIRYFLQAALGH